MSLRTMFPHAHRGLGAIHVLLTWIAGWWAIVLATPGGGAPNARSYEAFAAFMPDREWAILFALAAVFGIAGILDAKLRLISAHVLSVTHSVIAGLVAYSVPFSIPSGVYTGFAVLAYYFLWRQQDVQTGVKP